MYPSRGKISPWTPIRYWWAWPGKTLQSTSFSLAICLTATCQVSNDLCTLSLLKHLNLIGNPILCLPQKMKSLIMLETLLLDNCTNLKILPELPPRLKRLEAKYCTSLKRLRNLPNLGLFTKHLKPLQLFFMGAFFLCTSLPNQVLFRSLESLFWGCEHLVEVESLLNIKPLRNADIEMTRYTGLCSLKSISSTGVERSPSSQNNVVAGDVSMSA
ncbi:hypothetical protein DVH24_016773 [Malus domestica]|uniref:Uncharacterized protein n=1 Tax=Malus domestica TaxID=3750 RepID=A0A498HXN6_MALDO|nr:hypothetical protein DVH24_016773 [Malus domestica]